MKILKIDLVHRTQSSWRSDAPCVGRYHTQDHTANLSLVSIKYKTHSLSGIHKFKIVCSVSRFVAPLTTVDNILYNIALMAQ
jgi:hypothetical protein